MFRSGRPAGPWDDSHTTPEEVSQEEDSAVAANGLSSTLPKQAVHEEHVKWKHIYTHRETL